MTHPEFQWSGIEPVDTGAMVWAESPRWHDGDVWVSDTQTSRLIVVGPDGASRVHELDSAVNGTGFLPSGDLVAARMQGKRLDRFDGRVWSLHADVSAIVTGRLGDLIALPDGSVFVDEVQSYTEPGRLLRVDAGGTPSVAAEDLVFPNGLAIIDDGRTLVVAETFAGRLTAFGLGPDGALSDRRVYIDLEQELGAEYRPDGIWGCADGSIWVATTAGGAVVRVREGEIVQRVDVDSFAIACCMDATESTLFVGVAESLDPSMTVLEAVAEKRTSARVLRIHGDAASVGGLAA